MNDELVNDVLSEKGFSLKRAKGKLKVYKNRFDDLIYAREISISDENYGYTFETILKFNIDAHDEESLDQVQIKYYLNDWYKTYNEVISSESAIKVFHHQLDAENKKLLVSVSLSLISDHTKHDLNELFSYFLAEKNLIQLGLNNNSLYFNCF